MPVNTTGSFAGKSTGGGDGDIAADQIGDWSNPSIWLNSLPTFLGLSAYSDLNDPATNAKPPGPRASTIFCCPSALQIAPGASTDIVDGDFFMVYGFAPGTTTIQTRPTRLDYVINSKLVKVGTDKNNKLAACSRAARGCWWSRSE